MPFTDWAIAKLPQATLALLISLPAWAQSPKPEVITAAVLKPAPLKVVLDAGHGGEDQGAKGPKGLKEKDAALAIAQAVGQNLEKLGYAVILTRLDDTFIPLWDRAKFANEQGADIFLSLHLNAARAHSAKGSEVYFLSLGQAGEESAETVAAENAGADAAAAAAPGGPDSVVASILDDLAQKAFLTDSEKLAVAIQLELNKLAGIKQRGVKQEPFIVLRGAAMPAVLVETAFISNPKEEQKLKDPAFLDKVGQAIARGVRAYALKAGGTVRRKAEAGAPALAAPGGPRQNEG